MKIGYARVSTEIEHLDDQTRDLKAAGCCKVFYEKVLSVTTIKPELEKALRHMSAGDVFVVLKLDRLGLRTIELVSFLEGLNSRNIGFQSLTDSIGDTDGTKGDAYRLIISAFTELEKDLLQERTIRSLIATWASGKRSGPKEKVSDDTIQKGIDLLATPDQNGNPRTGAAVAKSIGLSRSSFYRRIKKLRAEDQKHSLDPAQLSRFHHPAKPS
ncbi:MAG: recombinase family protein [Sneathiella sp.]|nr:recombinase family protein [Sneathiella sp.]